MALLVPPCLANGPEVVAEEIGQSPCPNPSQCTLIFFMLVLIFFMLVLPGTCNCQ